MDGLRHGVQYCQRYVLGQFEGGLEHYLKLEGDTKNGVALLY
jgi:hypothetical protein